MKISELYLCQNEALDAVAEHGCKVCERYLYLGEISDVDGELWCSHCVRDLANLLTVQQVEVKRIP